LFSPNAEPTCYRGWLGDTESLASPAPTSLPKSRPNHQINPDEKENHAQYPKKGNEGSDANRGDHEDTDETEPPTTFLDHLAATGLARHVRQ
jgi:hypothetical protein